MLFADKILGVIENEKELAGKTIDIAQQSLNNN